MKHSLSSETTKLYLDGLVQALVRVLSQVDSPAAIPSVQVCAMNALARVCSPIVHCP